MKKFISMVMAAAMVVSLVPATAFAKGDEAATAKIVDKVTLVEGETSVYDGANGPELVLTMTELGNQDTTEGKLPTFDVNLTLTGAEWNEADLDADYFAGLVSAVDKDGTTLVKGTATVTGASGVDFGTNPHGALASLTSMQGAGAWTAGDASSYMTWDEIADEMLPAMTVEQQIAAYLADGYVRSADATALYKGADVIAVSSLRDFAAETELDAAERLGLDTWGTPIGAVAGNEGFSRGDYEVVVNDWDDNWVEMTIKYDPTTVNVGSKFFVNLDADLLKGTVGYKGTVDVDGVVVADDLVYAEVAGKALKASVRKLAEVAEEEVAVINSKGLKIEAAVGDLPSGDIDGEDLTIKISKGFEFTRTTNEALFGTGYTVDFEDEDELTVNVAPGYSSIVITGIEIAADTAKSGDVATLTVYADDFTKASVEVMKVIDYKVVMSVDADADVPTFYNGTDVANTGLTVEDDHMSLEVTIKETFRGAWDMDKKFSLSLPEGVYVTDVEVTDGEGYITTANAAAAFGVAYIDGDHVDFEFAKRVFGETDPNYVNTAAGDDGEANKVCFKLELVAAPTFVGDVVLTLEGAAVDTQEVVIAKVAAPYTVKAEQNDVIIDYRYTSIDTDIVVTEAEAGLWEEGMTFALAVEKEDYILFEDDAVFTVNADSDMEIEVDTNDGVMTFEVEEESEEVAAEVTINGIELFMQRNIPAGPYALELSNTAEVAFDAEVLLGQEAWACGHGDEAADCNSADDVADYSDVVKEAWVNVVTAGRDKDDASFTTTVVVPVGESYLVAGDKQYTLDVPAYINAAGYTMMPVRAVAVALGIDNDAVQWDNETKTVIIMYGQRVITMAAGQKVVYASGTAIPAKSAVEIVDGRAFLGLRDLATALGVTEINYDAATKTATLN